MPDPLPLVPSDAAAVQSALHTHAVLASLHRRALIELTGPEREDFLHRICSQDILGMAVGEGRPATLLTGKGRITAILVVWRFEDRLLLEVGRAAAPKVLQLLDMYLFTEKVEIRSHVDALSAIALLGPAADATLARKGEHPPGLCGGNLRTDGDALRLAARAMLLGSVGIILHAASEELGRFVEGLADLPVAGDSDLDLVRIRAGIPLAGVDTDDHTFPQEANLQSAFSVTKGCYVGQEVVARIETYGQVNRHLAVLHLDGGDPPAGGTPLRAEEEEVGRITSAARDPVTGQVWCLGFLPRILCEEGEEVSVATDDGSVARVVAAEAIE